MIVSGGLMAEPPAAAELPAACSFPSESVDKQMVCGLLGIT